MTSPTPDRPGSAPLELVLVLDRSGSMTPIRDQTIAGVNRLLDTMADEPDTAASIYQFDHAFTPVVESTPVPDCPRMDLQSYCPRGSTALLDAITEAVERTDHRLPELAEGTRIVLTIVTDGRENASRRATFQSVRALLDARTAAGWQVQFEGAGLDAIEQAAAMGIHRRRAAEWCDDPAGTDRLWSLKGAKLKAFKQAPVVLDQLLDYTDDDRDHLAGRGRD